MNPYTRLSLLALAATIGGNSFAQTDSTALRELHLDDVIVTGTRGSATTRHLPATVTVVGRETLTAQQRPNVLPTLSEEVPGLFVTSRGMMGYGVSGGAAGGISLRGISAGSGQMLVLIDGQPQYNGIYGHTIADTYQTLMAERIEVQRGPASMLYGSNAMGGVINIITRKNHDSPQTRLKRNSQVSVGAGSYGTVQAGISNNCRMGKFSWTMGHQYTRSDNHRDNMGFDQYNGYTRLGYDINDNWRVSGSFSRTHFDASNPGTTDTPMLEADQCIKRALVTVGVDNNYAKTNGHLSVYHNWGRHTINDGYAVGATPQTRLFQSKDALTGVSAYQNASLWTGGFVTLGLDYQHIYGNAWYTSRETGEVLDTPNKQSGKADMDEVAAYVDVRQEVTRWMTLDAGIRYDHHSVAGGEWIPQAGMVVRPLHAATLKLSVAKGFRNPTMREMYLYPPSNEDLLPERLWNYEVAWQQHLLDGVLTYGVNLFLIRGDNMIQTATVKTPEGGVKKQNINTGEISNRGVEFEASWRINAHWRLTTNHSYLYMEHPVLAAPTYKGYVGAHTHYGRWTASAGIQPVAGLYTALQEGETPATKEDFCLVNAMVGYTLPLGAQTAAFHPSLLFWVKGDNLLAQKYEINKGYPMPRATVMAGVNLNF